MIFSIVSRAIKWPGYAGFRSFGFLNTFWRLIGFILPKWDIFLGKTRIFSGSSAMILPIVLGRGHLKPCSLQKDDYIL